VNVTTAPALLVACFRVPSGKEFDAGTVAPVMLGAVVSSTVTLNVEAADVLPVQYSGITTLLLILLYSILTTPEELQPQVQLTLSNYYTTTLH